MEPIVPKLKRIIREKNISHAVIAERLGKHRTFITRKLGGQSMETRLLEDILRATDITYQQLFCDGNQGDAQLRAEVEALRKDVDFIKEQLPVYQTRKEA